MDATPPATEPQAAAPAAPSKFTAIKTCPHCGETKPNGHIQWCPKNPKKREHPSKVRSRRLKAERASKPHPTVKPKPAPEPVGNVAAFLQQRTAEIAAPAEAPKPSPAEPAATPAPGERKAGKNPMNAILIGFFVIALLFLLWRLSQATGGEQPARSRDPKAREEELEVHGTVPGVGKFNLGPDFKPQVSA